MTDSSNLPKRNTPAHHPVHSRGNRATVIFITVCTPKKKPILANYESMACIVKAWGKAEKWEYVTNNPARKSLVKDPRDWPFQGEVNRLLGHD